MVISMATSANAQTLRMLLVCVEIRTTAPYVERANFIYLWFPWDDPVNEDIPNSTQANFKGFPGTDQLNVPSEGREGKPSTQFLRQG